MVPIRRRGSKLGQQIYDWLVAQIVADKRYLTARLSRGVQHTLNGCVEWVGTGGQTTNGYRRISAMVDGREVKFYAHHVFWVLMNRRPIPGGMEIDHTCTNPRCVKHLELVTREENLKRQHERQKEAATV